MKTAIRQGDVLIVPSKSIPKTATAVDPENERLIVARGEATGHHHSFPHMRGAVLFRDDGNGGQMYVEAKTTTPLDHQEHSTLMLAPGKYDVRIQRVARTGVVQRVAD